MKTYFLLPYKRMGAPIRQCESLARKQLRHATVHNAQHHRSSKQVVLVIYCQYYIISPFPKVLGRDQKE